jgi:uridine phosphorylase
MSKLLDNFTPMHCTIRKEDTKNRYFIIPGCSSRAKRIADDYLTNVTIRRSGRGHNAYLGTLRNTNKLVGVISTGMGCPSIDIIVTELIQMGATHLMRLGTAGSFDVDKYPVGSIVVATGAVRDESCSNCYAPPEFPALASQDVLDSLRQVVNSRLTSYGQVKFGTVHTKDSLYAREFLHCPEAKKQQHTAYMNNLQQLGVIGSEMEAAHLFILGSFYGVNTGCVCTLVGGTNPDVGSFDDTHKLDITPAVELVVEAIKVSDY